MMGNANGGKIYLNKRESEGMSEGVGDPDGLLAEGAFAPMASGVDALDFGR